MSTMNGSFKSTRRQAFSLVELSIVLVILGLLTGGILAGQSLIRAAELRAISTEISRYQTAIYSFRDKYFALPGDMTNATKFWGVRAGTGSDLACHQTINTTTGTCNGDGNGQINLIAGDATVGERFAAWQHLAYAGLVEGSFTGASGNAASEVRLPGTNLPRGKVANSFYMLIYLGGPQSGSTDLYDGPYSLNYVFFDGVNNTLLPEEAWNVDTKMDDGRPAYGVMVAPKSTSTWATGCTTTDVSSTAEYALSNRNKLCRTLMFSLR